MRRALVGAAAAAAVLSAGACGGGGESASSTTTRPPASTTSATLPPWQVYEKADARFRAGFPHDPTRVEQQAPIEDVGDVTVIVYQSKIALGAYSVMHMDLRGLIVDQRLVLDGLQEFVVNETGTLESATEMTHLGHPARELVIKVDNGYAKMRLLATKDAVYLMEGTGPSQEPLRYAEFVASFQLL